jgi:uncharacterized protein (DUF433 family)
MVGPIAAGHSVDEVLADDDPYLEREDIRQALRYAASCRNVRTDPAPLTDPELTPLPRRW